MQAKKEQKLNPLLAAIEQIQSSQEGQGSRIADTDIVDIITFCDDPRYLNLPAHNFDLFLSQRTILKTFYMGTLGNEGVSLSKEEWGWLKENEEDELLDEMIYEKSCDQVIRKIRKQEQTEEEDRIPFRKLHLVLGRRASKTILASVITAYEVYKLITINDGDPHSYYGLPFGSEIVIINVALSQKQAGHLFGAISDRIEDAPIFQGRIAYGTTQEIGLYTNREIEKIKKGGNALAIKAPIRIICGHSNPKTLRGHNAILLLFDELAFYDDTGKVTGSQFYNDLEPSVSHFVEYGHDRIVCISSPGGTSGIFYDLFNTAETTDEMLAYQLPTWDVNPHVTYESLEAKRKRNPDGFAVEYGGQWAKSGMYGNYFPEDLISRSLEGGVLNGCLPMTKPDPKYHYYLHVDPAKNGDRYVAVLVARELYRDHERRKRIRVRLAHIWVWNPIPGLGIQFNEVDKEVVSICRTYRPVLTTYDQYNSGHSLEFIRKSGFRTREYSYNRAFKMKIYNNLREMMGHQPSPELWIYDDHRLILEMKCLKYRPTQRGYTLVKDKYADASTDDVIDCLAGAASSATNIIHTPLPAPVTVDLGRLR